MAELIFKSAGVGLREIDLSSPSSTSPTGTPAGVIGTSVRGPAFVPITFASYAEFAKAFGSTDGEKMAPLAMYEWLKNAGAGTFCRVLGAGDGKTKTTSGNNTGKVTNAGFTVGGTVVQSNGDLGTNTYGLGNYYGRTTFLGCYMSESAGSTYFSEAGAQPTSRAVPIIRGVLMTPSGVVAQLSGSTTGLNNTLPLTSAPTALIGYSTGSVVLASSKQEFVMFLSGMVSSTAYKNVITASFDPTAQNYFVSMFNTDPTKIEPAGHYLYSSYDIYSAFAVPTGSGNSNLGQLLNLSVEDIAFVLTGSSYNSGSTTVPNYESFESRFDHAFSPYVVSQKFGGVAVDLFKVHALDDGDYLSAGSRPVYPDSKAVGASKVKISIKNITPSTDPTSLYGTFDLQVRDFADTDDQPVVLESFIGLSIDPSSSKYFAKAIGDMNVRYDFDRPDGSQKVVATGLYPNVSSYIRVEVPSTVQNAQVPANSLPMGFRGLWHLITSGSSYLSQAGQLGTYVVGARQPPVPLRRTLTLGTGNSIRVAPDRHWGVQFETMDSVSEPNRNSYLDTTVRSHTRYFPKFHTSWLNPWTGDNTGAVDTGGTILDADRFNNNMFTLENVQVITSSVTSLPDTNLWTSASYSRNAVLASTFSRFVDPTQDFGDTTSRRYLKFSFPLQGGFNGVNVFDPEKAKLTNVAVKREMDYSSTQGGSSGPTVGSYRKAVDIMGDRSVADVQLLAIPGIRDAGVTDYAISAVDARFDALYIMDLPERNVYNNVITGSGDVPSVSLTVTAHKSRALDSSFAVAYYPDVVVTDPTTSTNLVVAPSVAVLGAFAVNDKVAYPWFAPAGFTRGALEDVVETQVKLSRSNLDSLYSVAINPIVTVPTATSPVIMGQKTLLARSSALDRVNVRRLLIEIRRRVRAVSNSILFEPNREATLSRFSKLVDPILKQVQAQQGVDRYKVKIDTTTTTQADVESNTVRGKIYVVPTRSVEFISLDFVVTNTGNF